MFALVPLHLYASVLCNAEAYRYRGLGTEKDIGKKKDAETDNGIYKGTTTGQACDWKQK